jgi:hypothetical protein
MSLPTVLVTLWTSGRIACVLVTLDGCIDTLAVQVRDGERTVLSEPTTDPDAAAVRARTLFAIFAPDASCT